MRSTLRLLLLILVPAAGLAEDVFLPIAGSPRTFRTDVRLFNASSDPETVTATFLPAGQDNTNAQGRQITIPARQMMVLNDVMRSFFNISDSSAVGAIRFSTDDDDLVVSARIYVTTISGTVGQFVPGLKLSDAELKGVLVQLKATGEIGVNGTFRTNLGFMNPNSVAANVTIRLYDKNNAVIGGAMTRVIPALSVDFPRDAASPLRLSATAADFSEAWVSYESNLPVFGIASVVDNGTADAILILGEKDSGSGTTQPPPPATKTFNVTARNFQFDVAEGLPIRVKSGDDVIIKITSAQGTHGFAIQTIAPASITIPNGQTRELSFKAPLVNAVTTFQYFCTFVCGEGHDGMQGVMIVEPRDDSDDGGVRY